jgi:adenylate kinase
MDDIELQSFMNLVHATREGDDANLHVHAAVLEKEIEHYRTLVLPHAKRKSEVKIRDEVRQLERRRSSATQGDVGSN